MNSIHIGPTVKQLSKLAPVLPLYSAIGEACTCPKGAQCKQQGKHPASSIVRYDSKGRRWSATQDLQQIHEWEQTAYSRNLEINWALVTGQPIPGRPGWFLVVVDVDPRNGGDELLGHYEAQYGKLSETWTVLTGGGGQHYYLAIELPTAPATMALVGGIEL